MAFLPPKISDDPLLVIDSVFCPFSVSTVLNLIHNIYHPFLDLNTYQNLYFTKEIPLWHPFFVSSYMYFASHPIKTLLEQYWGDGYIGRFLSSNFWRTVPS